MAVATTTAIVIGLALTAASTAVSLYASDTANKQQEANLKFQAAQSEADARAAQGEAEVEAMRIRKSAKAQRAQATAAAAAAGIDVNSPTAVRINEGITKNSEEDALLTIMGGKDRSARLNQQAQADRTGASIVRSEGRTAQAGTLLSAASSAYNSYGTGWKRSSQAGG